MLITNDPGGEIAVVHTLSFENTDQRNMFHEYANAPDGLPVARGAPGNMFACPYNSSDDDHTIYMFSRWESEKDWDNYFRHRKEISPDWFLPNCEPHTALRLRELDSSPTKNSTQAPLFAAREGAVANFHIWQFEDDEFKNAVNEFWALEDGLPASVAYPGNILVSAFEAIDRENQLVVLSAWESQEIFLAYRQMRRDTAPDYVQPFLADDVMIQSTIVAELTDPRARA